MSTIISFSVKKLLTIVAFLVIAFFVYIYGCKSIYLEKVDISSPVSSLTGKTFCLKQDMVLILSQEEYYQGVSDYPFIGFFVTKESEKSFASDLERRIIKAGNRVSFGKVWSHVALPPIGLAQYMAVLPDYNDNGTVVIGSGSLIDDFLWSHSKLVPKINSELAQSCGEK